MHSLRYLNKYFVKYKWLLILGVLFIIGSNYFKVMMNQYFGEVTDKLPKEISSIPADDILMYALKIGGLFMLLAILSGFFLFLTRQTIIIMSRHIEFDLKNEIYNQYQRLNYSFYVKNNTGDLMNRISEDVSKVRMYLGPGVMYTINLFVLSVICVTAMVNLSPYLTFFVLLPLPVMSFIIYKVSSRINDMSMEVQKEQSRMSTLVQETFSGIRVVKAYGRNKEITEKFDGSSEEYKNRSMRLVLVNSLFMPTIFVLIGISTILCIYLGGLLHYDKETTKITMGVIIQFIFYVNMLTWPFASIGWVISIIQRAAASQERINEFLQLEPEIKNPSTKAFEFQGSIEFRNVSYTYPGSGVEVLHDISFRCNKGETLGIVGRTGSGKSTLIKLLMRQVDPTEGTILIDGNDLSTINLDEFRNQTGIVPQDVFLFSDTIRNNLKFGSLEENVDDKELEEVTKKAHVLGNIQAFKNKFDTILGERGVNLSGGQKQRISIARALIRHPRLLLLDDCLSAVDTETEGIILENIRKVERESTIIVSHRISTLRNADHIISIDGGRIVEQGTQQELLKLNGLFKEIYQKQLEEEQESK